VIPQYEPVMTTDYAKAVSNQVLANWIGPGPVTLQVEDYFAETTGKDFSFATTSGTTALWLALNAMFMFLPASKRTVLFPAYTFLAGANAALSLGYNVRLVDVDQKTLCMNLDSLRRAITPDVGIVLFVNHNGYVGHEREMVREICTKHKILMIEDAAQCVGIFPAGNLGDISTFSFSAPKIVSCGQGGVLVTSNPDFAQAIDRLRDQGGCNWRKTRIHSALGLNFKFDDIHAALLLAQLRDLSRIKVLRRKIWDAYENRIKIYRYGQDFTWMIIHPSSHADQVITALYKEGIQATKYYLPINRNRIFEDDRFYPGAEWATEYLVYLPSSHNLSGHNIQIICDIIEEVEK
jgi:perosamine synthetase